MATELCLSDKVWGRVVGSSWFKPGYGLVLRRKGEGREGREKTKQGKNNFES